MPKWLFDLAFKGADLWNALLWMFPPLGAAVTAWRAYVEMQPWHLIIFYSTGVFAFCAFALYAVSRFTRENTLYERLRLQRSEPLFVEPNKTANTISIMFKCTLLNASDRVMYFRLKRASVILQDKANSKAETKEMVCVLPPRADQAFQIAAVPKVDIGQPIAGKMEVEVLYGPRSDHLRYAMTYETTPTIEIKSMTDEKAQISYVAPVTKYDHTLA
jgi:hypothetical protein